MTKKKAMKFMITSHGMDQIKWWVHNRSSIECTTYRPDKYYQKHTDQIKDMAISPIKVLCRVEGLTILYKRTVLTQ